MDRQTRFQGDSIAAAVLAGDVPVRSAAAFDLLASLSLAAPAAPAGDLDLREAQGARAPAQLATVNSAGRRAKAPGQEEGRCSIFEKLRRSSKFQTPKKHQAP